MAYQSWRKWAGLWLGAMLCIGLAAAPAPLAAQSEADEGSDIETQRFESWTVRCRPASETEPRTCRMHQQLVAQEDGKPVLRMVVGRFGPENILGAVIVVPIGVRLPPGLGIQIDEGPIRTFPFEICDSSSCQARAVLEADLLKDLKAGLVGTVKFQNAAGQVLGIPVSLKGFSAALKALP
jgi:invasion protein IalB